MGDRPALVMEWYQNGSAMEYLRSKNPEADRLKLVRMVHSRSQYGHQSSYFLKILEVAAGLKYLHNSKIVHGDLKAVRVQHTFRDLVTYLVFVEQYLNHGRRPCSFERLWTFAVH